MAMVNYVEIDDADDTMLQYEHSLTEEKQIMTVDFELNKVNAMNKKIAACDKENYKLFPQTSCCTVRFSTAAFEVFLRDIYAYLLKTPEYTIDEENSKVVDQNGYITGNILRVYSTGEREDIPIKNRDKLFTINL